LHRWRSDCSIEVEMLSQTPTSKPQAGFSLIEMVVVLAIIIVGSAIVIPVSRQMARNSDSYSSLELVSTFLQSARNRAVAERRNIVLNFTSSTQVQIERIEVPSNLRTVLDTLTLRGEEQFLKLGATTDTPDLFGATTNVYFTGTLPVMFTSDGSLIDNAGDIANGSVFIARPNSPDTARAISITGVTGMLRKWKWRSTEWQP
jgi:prepilin-type N-terminal cleavage/methylation domain-containing protein